MQVAAKIRAIHPPDAYKGKGIRYSGEKFALSLARLVGQEGKRNKAWPGELGDGGKDWATRQDQGCVFSAA